MQYVAPKAEVVELDIVESLMLLLPSPGCIIYDPFNPACGDKLPDFFYE